MTDALFYKILLLLSAVYFVRVCGKSPQPPPKKCEEKKFTGLETRGFRAIIRWVPPLLVLPSMFLTLLCESLQISLQYSRSHFLSAPSELPSSTGRNVTLTSTFVVGWLLLASGAFIRATCYRHLGRFFTFELALREGHQLVTTGPYSIVRHPAYTGSILALTGMALMQLGPGSYWTDNLRLWSTPVGVVMGCLWLGILSIIPAGIIARTAVEDEVLRKEFGGQWDNWAQKTEYKLVPGVF
ncbi:uncharacterized protein C8Q71DRAFT_825774 [Rhodofomes roseus]|uniref:Protein-S-isoprenylcysteine O-methyltransferase n=1 Tax=Rhodofomes roseus TaxID=34475 RepID=A0ABQ8KWV2_9APHY|nr:uncharacterized protein C8Q71DRAFT_825774 [Rhodofomes roseus]KAH9843782.1 hypothetical protein C8Q71DRAFT_825774 [Rhodofomes roseus]